MIFVVTNEALLMLLHIDKFHHMMNLNRKLVEKKSHPRYTRPENRHEMFCGCYRKVITHLMS